MERDKILKAEMLTRVRNLVHVIDKFGNIHIKKNYDGEYIYETLIPITDEITENKPKKNNKKSNLLD